MKTLLFLFITFLSFIFYSCGSGGSSSSDNSNLSDDSDYINPTYKTEDNEEFVLLSPKEMEEAIDIRNKILEKQKKSSQKTDIIKKTELPRKVFLKDNQTSIKSQGGRGTCTSFAFAGALEAAYKRDYGLNLNLSEQFLNHIQKIQYLRKNKNLPTTETSLGAWGGAGVSWISHVLQYGTGIPESRDYISKGCYENTNEDTDNPKYKWKEINRYTQKAFNDFNLYEGAIGVTGDYEIEERILEYKRFFKFPNSYGFLCSESLPLHFSFSNLANAKYGIASKRIATTSQLRDLNWYKQQLAEGKEIVFSTTLYPDEFKDGVWLPKEPYDDRKGGHAMLMVGYDDDKQAFIIKNSWGKKEVKNEDGSTQLKGRPIKADEDADGFLLFGYKWIEEGLIWDAVVINSVIKPDFYNERYIPSASLLGRWKVFMGDGEGILDIYHFPNLVNFSFSEKRFGTFFDETGNGYRVNGNYFHYTYFDRNEGINFYFNYDNPNMGVNENTQGRVFKGYLDKNFVIFTGYYTDENDGEKYGFIATKELHRITNSDDEHPNLPSENTYKGYWFFKSNGERCNIWEVETSGNIRTYRGYIENYSFDYGETGFLERLKFYEKIRCELKTSISKPTEMDITITTESVKDGEVTTKTQVLKGYLLKNNPYMMAGYFIKDGIKYSMYSKKQIDLYNMTFDIKKPYFGGRYFGKLFQRNVRLEAEILNESVYPISSSEYKVVWFYKNRKVGEGLNVDAVLPYSDYSSLKVCLVKVSDPTYCLSSKIYLVKVENIPPMVDITTPNNNDTFCTDENINFRVDITDANGETIHEDTIQWVFSPYGEKYGKEVTSFYRYPGTYTVLVRYQDEGGEIGEDSININITECSNNPPYIKITSPENGSELPEPDNRYNDGTEDITITVDYIVSDKEDGTIPKENITWMLYVPSTGYTYIGNYSEIKLCNDPTPLGCGSYVTVKQVKFDRIPSCEDVYLKASAMDSDKNFGEDSILLKKRIGCDLI